MPMDLAQEMRKDGRDGNKTTDAKKLILILVF